MTWNLHHGDCRKLMADMEGCSVDSIVTDPPYDLTANKKGGTGPASVNLDSPAGRARITAGFMGMAWDATGVAFEAATWAEALRVLKPGGWLVAFGGSRTYHRLACAIEDAGFEIRDQIMWIYGSGFPKGGNRDGKGTCLKPAHEPIVLARKPLIGSVAANEAAFGTGALNIDACRVPTGDVLSAGAGGIPMRHDPAVSRGRLGEASASARYQDRGSTDFAATPGPRGGDPLGRWPANIVHDGSEDAVAGFPWTQATGARTDASKARWGAESPMVGSNRTNAKSVEYAGDSGSAARFFYCAKASKADRDEGLDGFAPQAFVQFQTANGESGAASSLSAGRDTEYRNTHPTVKPEALMRWLVRLVTPESGLVLDPFTGSGSTGKAAILEGRQFIGCELTDAYLPIARARIADAERRATEAAAPPPQIEMAL